MFKNIIENRNLTHIYMTTHVPGLEQGTWLSTGTWENVYTNCGT
jgi:hypothetical protein